MGSKELLLVFISLLMATNFASEVAIADEYFLDPRDIDPAHECETITKDTEEYLSKGDFMQIFIKDRSGRSITTMEVKKYDKIGLLKEKIFDRVKNNIFITSSQQIWYLGDVKLENHHTLADYRIYKDATLILSDDDYSNLGGFRRELTGNNFGGGSFGGGGYCGGVGGVICEGSGGKPKRP